MLHYLGRGLSGLRSTTAVQTITPPVSSSVKLFDFMTGSLPLEFNYTRSDSAATTRNASGKLVAVLANTPRFDHDEAGNALGLRIEPVSTNKCTNTNVNPTDTSGFTKGGDANSTISVVDAPAGLLEAADLEQLCTNGKVFYLDNSAGTSNAYVDIAGEVGNTNIHSASVYAAAAVSGYNGTFRWLVQQGLWRLIAPK